MRPSTTAVRVSFAGMRLQAETFSTLSGKRSSMGGLLKTAAILAALIAASAAGPAFAQTSATGSPEAGSGAPPAAEPQTQALSNSPGRAVWASNFDEAKELAKKQGKVVFVEFTRNKCGNCLRMDELKDDRSFYVHLHNSMKEWDSLNLRLVHEPETIDNAKAVLELGKELFRRVDAEEALPRLQRAATLPKATPAVREEALAYLASAQMELERFADARATTGKLL